jgi:hypothetical protein
MYPQGGVRTPMDDTYRKALADGSADGILYKERQSRAKSRR